MPVASYQCTSARRTVPSPRRTWAKPFRFLHLPRPYNLRRRPTSRMDEPAAKVSTCVISPISSKYILDTQTFAAVLSCHLTTELSGRPRLPLGLGEHTMQREHRAP